MPRDYLRHIELDSRGGKYQLRTWDTGRYHSRGTSMIGYEFIAPDGSVLFTGEDFSNSPMDAIDADESVRSLLNFITLRPGDTDRDYFAEYTPEQLAFAEGDAEELQMYALDTDCEPYQWHNLDDWEEE